MEAAVTEAATRGESMAVAVRAVVQTVEEELAVAKRAVEGMARVGKEVEEMAAAGAAESWEVGK